MKTIFAGTYAKIYEDRLRVNNIAGITTTVKCSRRLFIGCRIAA